ncbi:hypothetical protein V9T40_013634 [Parthenolecanium corni]|uniref:Uncharacterized protein n=1 Tax=Parthenolecanium corni TaxID=536013 RepID=A0AAN9Y1F5_9HEMI
MPDCIKNRALYSSCVTVLAITGFALATTATILPLWGYYSNPTVTTPGRVDRGHFGPWQTCVETYFGKTKCGDFSKFQPVVQNYGYNAVDMVALQNSAGAVAVSDTMKPYPNPEKFGKIENALQRYKVVRVMSHEYNQKIKIKNPRFVYGFSDRITNAVILLSSLFDGIKKGDGVSSKAKSKIRLNLELGPPITAVRISGYFAIAGVLLLGIFCVLSVLHLAMVVSKEKVVMKFKSAVMAKLVFSILSEIIAIIVGVLFAFQTDDKENSYQVTRGESFYLQVGLIIIIFLLFITSLYDLIFARRSNGDPTAVRDPTGVEATTFNNPGFREKNRGGHAISMTEASGKPYSSNSGTNGSMVSMSTVISSNGSTTTSFSKGPLRSSLKKPRVSTDPSLGIHNPGFSGSSPTLPRDGMKKVRIQTQSTAV